MRPPVSLEVIPFQEKFEARKNFMYLDIRGIVTTGIGCALLTVEQAKSLPFFHEASKARASAEEIAKDYEKLKKAKKGQLAKEYKKESDLRLDDAAVIDLINKRIADFEREARRVFPSFDNFPADAQLAIISYLFAGGNITKAEKLTEAIKSQNWWRAAAECHLKDEIEKPPNPGLLPRNDTNRRLFSNAGRVKAFELDPSLLYFKTPKPVNSIGVGVYYLFGSNGNYLRYDWISDKLDCKGARRLDAWGIPDDFASGVNAIFNGGCNGKCHERQFPHTGKAYFVNGNSFLVYDWDADQLESTTPRPLSELGLEGVFADRLDAVVRGRGPFQNKLYFFSGGQYLRVDLETNQVDLGPTNMAGWALPPAFNGTIDVALNGEGEKYRDKLYLFKGNLYTRYSWNAKKWIPDPGYENGGTFGTHWDRYEEFDMGVGLIGALNSGLTI